jgi:hypothetical protein
MMIDGDLSYYRRRIEQERSAADCAASPGARAAHHGLAELYAVRLDLLNAPSAWQAAALAQSVDTHHQRFMFEATGTLAAGAVPPKASAI